MASTGFKSPTSNGTPATYDGSATEFTNPANAYADDSNYATVVDNELTYKYQSYGDFNFNLPANAVVVGVEVAVKGKTSTGSALAGAWLYADSGSKVYTYNSSYFTTSETTYTYGGATSNPGGYDAGDMVNGNFAVLVTTGSSNDGKTISLNHVSVNVHYTVTEASPSDSITIQESYTVVRDPEISVTDQFALAEFSDVYDGVARIVNGSDSLSITEYITKFRMARNGGRPPGTTLRSGM